MDSPPWILLLLALGSQAIFTTNILRIKFSLVYSDVAVASTMGILFLGLLPILILVLCVNGYRFTNRDNIPLVLIAGGLVVLINLPLAFTYLAALNTEQLYGGVTASQSSTKAFRVSLPGFPGTVSGGVFSGIVASGALVYAWFETGARKRVIALSLAGACLVLIWLTEVRSAIILLSVMAALAVTGVWRQALAFPKCTATVLTVLPAMVFFLYPPFVESVIAVTPDFLQALLSRNPEDNVMMLSGRVSMWESYYHNLPDWPYILIGYGPLGEYLTGMAEYSSQRAGLDFSNMASVHAHNIFLNILYSNGLIGLLIFGGLFWKLSCLSLERARISKSSIAMTHAALVVSISIEGTLESLYSTNYEYFLPLTTLLVSELLYSRVANKTKAINQSRTGIDTWMGDPRDVMVL